MVLQNCAFLQQVLDSCAAPGNAEPYRGIPAPAAAAAAAEAAAGGPSTAAAFSGDAGRAFEFHWHVRKPLEAVFWTQARATEGGPDDDAKKHARSAQFETRAMQRMVNSLAGTKFYGNKASGGGKGAGLATAVAEASGGDSGGGKKAQRPAAYTKAQRAVLEASTAGSGQSNSQKAQEIRAVNMQRLAQAREQGDAERMTRLRAALARDAPCTSLLSDLDQFLAGCETDEARAAALALKLLVLYASIKKAAASGGQQQQQVHKLVATSLEAVGRLKRCGPAAAHTELAVPKGPALAWAGKDRTPAHVAVAVLSALGFSNVAQQLAAELQPPQTSAAPSDVGAKKGGKKGGKAKASIDVPSAAAATAATATAPPIAACKKMLDPLPFAGSTSAARFQLQHMGPLLERPAQGPRDARISGFVPDLWQRKLLDAVDAGASAVISAPTSSGKTFISSYVIQKVLDADIDGDNGIVCVVVPTKALVHQVAAQV